MKNTIVTLCFLLFSLILKSQSDIQSILNNGNDYNKMCQQADDYFKQKHPLLDPIDLVKGKHRDGEFVKYMRWRSYWKNSLNPDGSLGDIAAYHQNNDQLRVNEDLYDEIEWSNISNKEFIRLQISMGRTTSIAFHPTDPDIFYVGAAIGGIWKTEDGGKSYIPLGDDLPFLAVSSIIVNQDNPETLYISVGDHVWFGLPSIGVYKSTNGGLTWNPTNFIFSTIQNTRIYWLAADPNDSNTLLAGTQSGLYKTTDGFTTYSQITFKPCYQAHYKHGNSDIVYLGTTDGEFWKSEDAAENFRLIDDFGTKTVRIAITAQDPDKIVITHETTLRVSRDSGETFTESHALPENGSNQYISINPQNPEDYVGGYFDLFRSTDGGNNFNQISHWLGNGGLPVVHVDMRNTFINPLQNDRLYFCHDGGIDAYNIETGEFIYLSNGLIITQYYDIAVSQSNENVVSGGSQDNGSMYRDGNGVWDDLAGTGDGMVTEIDPSDENTIYWEYQFGSMNRFNGVNNTNISPPGQNGQGAWITPYRLDPNNPNRIIAGYKNVYESMNRGNSWTDISGQLSNGQNLNHIAIAESNSERIYATHSSQLYVKAIDSDSWTTKNLPSGSITDIEVHPSEMNTIIITIGGYSDGAKVFISEDAGDIWKNISGDLPNIRFGAVEYYKDIENAVFIGSDAGVYYRDDSFAKWIPYGQLPNTRVNDIEIQYEEQKIRVGTYGRGIFEANIDIIVCSEDSPDQDGDGVCDVFDLCPELDDNLIGTPCDDEDPFSSNEMYSNDCNCEGGESNLDYCEGQGAPGTGSDYINNVLINDLNNSSGKTAYSDFRYLSTDLFEDSSYVVTISLGFSFPPDTAYAWIDFDRSGSFDDNELITMSMFNNHISIGAFTVPELEEYGATTMRVRNIYGDNVTADPCGSYFGEVEDYTIQLKQTGNQLVDLDQDGFFSDEDCDDMNPDINPGQIEEPYNGIDDDCDPLTFDDDLDEDGFVIAEDCDDMNPTINPDVEDIPDNGIDEDCDGEDNTSTSTSNIEQGLDFILIPNPASISISIVKEKGKKISSYSIISIDNRVITRSDYSQTIDINDLTRGIYFIKLFENQKMVGVKRFIKI